MSNTVPARKTLEEPGLQAEVERLNKIIQALMNRAERTANAHGSDFNLFHNAVTLEDMVHMRTDELEAAMRENEKINRALRESENHNRLLIENSPMCIHEIDMEGRISSMNRSGLLMLGLKDEIEVLGYPYLQAVAESDRDRIGALLEKAYAGKTSHFEFTSSGPQGQIYRSCFVPIKDKNGRVGKLMGITEDITLRKQMERQLMEREALFRTVFDQAPMGIELIDPDTLRFIEANAAACRMLGYTRDEFLHLRLPDTQVGMESEQVKAYVKEIERQGGANFENRHRCKNGEILDVEVNAHMLNLSGKRLLVGLWRDISEHKRAQEEIEFKNTILQTQLEVSPDAILVVDDNGKIISCNQQFIDLWRLPPQLVNARLDALVLQAVSGQVEDSQAFVERVNYLYLHREDKSREEIRLKDGRVIDRYSAPITGAEGKYYGRVWYLRDITERRRTEDQIRNLAFNDALTQLPNRRLLHDRLKQAMAASKRSSLYGALMFIDLDNFKPLNDLHGHDVGDLLLIEVAHRITDCLREMDTVARFGGDEFVVLLGELDAVREPSAAQARNVAEKIRAALAEPYILMHVQEDAVETTVEHHSTASIGIELFNDHAVSEEDILKFADLAMYQAKSAGRNRVKFYEANPVQTD
jgi:diguanylate cyclase (GGDEF)-like protein/PAS domain S-box-containing protein